MKKKKFGKKKIVIIVVAVIVVILIAGKILNGGRTATAYQEEVAQTRDITNYLEFSGNIEAVDVSNVFAKTTAQVLEVLVEEGDEVKVGEPIILLDSGDIEYNIELQEKALELNKLQDTYNIKDSRTSLDNLNTQIESGLNQTLNQAQKTLLSTQEQYQKAVDSYNEAKADYENDNTDAIVNAKRNLEAAQKSYSAQQYSITHMSDGTQIENLSDEYISNQLSSLSNQISQYQSALDDARTQAKEQVEDYYTAVEEAQTALDDAEKDYETTLLSVSQNVESSKAALEKVQALSNKETSEMELEHLRESLEDYTIYAPIDGFVTVMNANAGEYIATTVAAAEITNLDKMQVSVSIDEYDIAQVEVGENVEIYINALDTYYEGKIARIAKKATVKNDVSYLEAVVEFEADDKISSGLSAEVKLIKAEEKDTVALPISAIQYDTDNSAYVLLKGTDGKEVKTAVTLGISDGSYVQITEGVKAGDVVLRTPSMNDYYQMMMQGPTVTTNAK